MKMLCRMVVVVALSSCGSTRGDRADPDGDRDRVGNEDARRGAVIVVKNPTRDTWDIALGGVPRGSVAPGSEARLLGIARGRQTVVAANERLGLSQTTTVDVAAGEPAQVVLKPMLARLRVNNPHPEGVALAIDGTVIGTATAAGETVFEGVPAGRRMLMLRSTVGPGAVRVERDLPVDGEALLTVPALDTQVVDPNAVKAPEGQGLVRMRNASRLTVTVLADGKDYGVVPAGAVLDLVLAPGTHKLEVRIAGIEARTEHTVTLSPNQVAEWVWGAEAP